MRVAVTGVGGFVGSHATAELTRAGHSVLGIGLGATRVPEGLTEYVQHDLTEGWPPVGRVDAVLHLAALAAVGPSFADPQRYYWANSAPLTHLCESILASGTTDVRVLNVSSGAVYAPGVRRTEVADIEHSSPYVVSKLLGELQSSYYRRRGLDITTVRPFNHTGPGQRVGFLLPDLADAIEVARASGSPMTVGDLDTRRDYTDVRDVVSAYRLLLEQDAIPAGTYNVCSGRTVSGREILGGLLSAMPGQTPELTVDPSRLRPNDPREVSGDPTLLQQLTGWQPRYSLTETVRDFVEAR